MVRKKLVKKQIKNKATTSIKCVWGLLCSMSAIDQQQTNISLFNIIDQLNIPRGEFEKIKQDKSNLLLPISHELVLFWRRTLGINLSDEYIRTELKLSLVDPRGKILSELLTTLEMPSQKRSVRFRMQNTVFTVTEPGDYVYRIEIIQPDGKDFMEVLQIPFLVCQID